MSYTSILFWLFHLKPVSHQASFNEPKNVKEVNCHCYICGDPYDCSIEVALKHNAFSLSQVSMNVLMHS